MTKKINDVTLAILSRVTVEGNNILLTCGQLDRKQYQAVDEVIKNIGGKWNRKAKAHVFQDNPTDKLEHVLLTGEITKPEKFGYFPTPAKLAQQVVALAEISQDHAVLEPSAGQGGIADHVPCKDLLDCVELLPENITILEQKGYRVISGDFLEVEIAPMYDRVVMNPPFEKQADIDHVLKAWECVKPGGRLVSIMASNVVFRENRKTVEFRELLESHGTLEHNPVGSFKESGTMVNTVIIVMDKPLAT